MKSAISTLEGNTVYLSSCPLDEDYVCKSSIKKVSNATRVIFLESNLYKKHKGNKEGELMLVSTYTQTALLSIIQVPTAAADAAAKKQAAKL